MKRIVVLGAGIVGLWTAYELRERGFDVTVVSKGDHRTTTSAAAVSVLLPLLPYDPGSEEWERNIRWERMTREKFLEVNPSSHAVEDITSFEFGKGGCLEADFPLEKLKHLDTLCPTKHDFPSNVDGYEFAVEFGCPLAHTQTFLPWIYEYLRSKGVIFTRELIETPNDFVNTEKKIAELDPDVIFNCLGFNEVFPDDDLAAMHGQSMFVKADTSQYEKFGIGAEDHAVFTHSRGFYIGSYFKEGEQVAPREELYELSREFVRNKFPVLCESVGKKVPTINLDAVERVNAGNRPMRKTGGRVTLDYTYSVPVVHNYGHGAQGWTVGYGSSVEAVNLMMDGFENGELG